MGAIPTIRAKRKSDGYEAVINVSDFDPELWSAVDKKEAPKALAEKARLDAAAESAAENARALEINAAAKRRVAPAKSS